MHDQRLRTILLGVISATVLAACGVTHTPTASKPTSASTPTSIISGTGSTPTPSPASITAPASDGTAPEGTVPQFPRCHEDSTQIKQTSDKGGPARLGPDTSGQGKQAYYYLTLTAGCGERKGTPVKLTVKLTWTALISGKPDGDGQCWSLDFHKGYDHRPTQGSVQDLMFGGLGSSITLTSNAFKAGDHVRVRIANLENDVIQDHVSVDG
jgi:hypothetical protein